ncbi:hypothetical protein Tco_1547322 [Tanacetum coccineum]
MEPLLDIKNQRDEDLKRKGPGIVSLCQSSLNYCFKAIVNDGSTTTFITCFSDQANTLTRDCNEVLAETINKDPYTLPPSLEELEGTTHTFQFHFDTGSTAKRPDFILETVFKNPTLALPAPVPTETPEPQTTIKRKETLLQDLTEVDANKTNPTETTTSQQTNPQSSIPTSPKSACTESETQEPEDEDSTKKGDGKSKLSKTSVRKALFGKDPEPDLTEVSKKQKHDQ